MLFPLFQKNCHSCCGMISHVQLKSVTSLVCAVSTEDSHEAKFLPPPDLFHVLKSSLNLLFVFYDHPKSCSKPLPVLCYRSVTEYVSLVTAQDCWSPFSFCITSVLLSCFATPLPSLSKDHHNFCVQLWSTCSVFSKA